MGGYVQVVVGVAVEKADLFEMVEQEVVYKYKWDGEGEVPKFHPDTGERLREVRKVRNLKPAFTQFKAAMDEHYENWRVDRELDDYYLTVALSEASEDLSIYQAHTPNDCSEMVLGTLFWSSGDLNCSGPLVVPRSLTSIEESIQEVNAKLKALGIDREAKICFMSGWED